MARSQQQWLIPPLDFRARVLQGSWLLSSRDDDGGGGGGIHPSTHRCAAMPLQLSNGHVASLDNLEELLMLRLDNDLDVVMNLRLSTRDRLPIDPAAQIRTTSAPIIAF
jgi:hypothetical protein